MTTYNTTNNTSGSVQSEKSGLIRTILAKSLLALIITVLFLANIACSGDSNPVIPDETDLSSVIEDTGSPEPTPLGLLDVTFDPASGSLEYTDARSAETYINVTPFLWDDFVTITLTNYDAVTKILEFEMEIENPTIYDAYDPRVLFLRTDPDAPELVNINDYTEHYNAYSCHEINPFRSFCKFETGRIFAAGTSHSENFEVLIQGPPYTFELLIMAALPGNTEECYEIAGQWNTGPVSAVQSTIVYATVYDHQNDIDQVYMDTTILTGGTTPMVNIGGDLFMSADIYNTQGLVPGDYWFRIHADSANTTWDLIDMVLIEVLIDPWIKDEFPLTTDSCSMDIGVISDPGGPRDSQILISDSGTATGSCDAISAYDPYYAGSNLYVPSLSNLDPPNPDYNPWPVVRIDAAKSGAFSITNANYDPFEMILGQMYDNYQVWSVFDAAPQIHLNPSPDSSRYTNITGPNLHPLAFPIDVCDDFDGGQYTLFTTAGNNCMKDLLLVGTMPDTYTHDRVKYIGNLDAWIGSGAGHVDPEAVKAIDVYVVDREEYFSAVVYILEESGTSYQVEVFSVGDTAPGWGFDLVEHLLTIEIQNDFEYDGLDIELLPANPDYDENPSSNFPTLCVLSEIPDNAGTRGQVDLFNAYTGAYLENLGWYFGPDPLFKNCEMHYLDVDDDNWEIHVTWKGPNGVPMATVFTHT